MKISTVISSCMTSKRKAFLSIFASACLQIVSKASIHLIYSMKKQSMHNGGKIFELAAFLISPGEFLLLPPSHPIQPMKFFSYCSFIGNMIISPCPSVIIHAHKRYFFLREFSAISSAMEGKIRRAAQNLLVNVFFSSLPFLISRLSFLVSSFPFLLRHCKDMKMRVSLGSHKRCVNCGTTSSARWSSGYAICNPAEGRQKALLCSACRQRFVWFLIALLFVI